MKIVDKILTKLFDMDKSVIILFIFSILGSFVNYAFQIVLGNMLTISDYGDFNTINSLSTNLVCLYSPLAIYACRISAEKRNNLFANSLNYQRIFVFTLLISFIIMSVGGGLFIFSPRVRFGTKAFSFWIFILFMTSIAGIYTVLNGILQGVNRFGWYGFLGFVMMIVKMGLSYIGVKLGGRVSAVVWAMLISYVIVICFIIVIIGLAIKQQCKNGQGQVNLATEYKEILQLYGITFLVQMLISPYINGGEIILMSYFYDNEAVGLYSLAANVARIGMYVLSILTSVLLPNVSSDWSSGKNVKRKFYIAMVFAFGVGITWFLFLSTIGRQLVFMFLGERYYEALSNIKYMALWMIGLGMLIVANTFYLAINRLKTYLLVLVIVTVGIIGCVAISGIDIVYVPVVISSGILLILLFAFVDMKGLVNPNNTKG